MEKGVWMILIASFIAIHTLGGDEISVNVDHVASLTPTRDGEGNKLMAESVNCVVGLDNGRFFSTKESCPSVRRRIEEAAR